MPRKNKSRRDPVVVIASIIALFFVYLTFTKNWLYIVPAVILMILNQSRLMGKN